MCARGRDRAPAADFYPRSPCGERPHVNICAAEIANFYPRSPCGERRCAWCKERTSCPFLSTLSLRRATCGAGGACCCPVISIHALLAESDVLPLPLPGGPGISIHALLAESDEKYPVMLLINHHFYPRSPCGERPSVPGFSQRFVRISIHALLAESDTRRPRASQSTFAFLSTLSLRRATALSHSVPALKLFLSTLSLRRATWTR